MMDIADTFRRYCGPSVQYLWLDRGAREIKITYKIPAVDADQQHTVTANLRNGLAPTLYLAVRGLAENARNDAYRRTGHREADMQHLLSGRII